MAIVATISVFYSEERVEVVADAAATEFCKSTVATIKLNQADSTTSSGEEAIATTAATGPQNSVVASFKLKPNPKTYLLKP